MVTCSLLGVYVPMCCVTFSSVGTTRRVWCSSLCVAGGPMCPVGVIGGVFNGVFRVSVISSF